MIDRKGYTFRDVNSALKSRPKIRKEKVQRVKQANFISEEQEKYLWEHGFIGSEKRAIAPRYVVMTFATLI